MFRTHIISCFKATRGKNEAQWIDKAEIRKAKFLAGDGVCNKPDPVQAWKKESLIALDLHQVVSCFLTPTNLPNKHPLPPKQQQQQWSIYMYLVQMQSYQRFSLSRLDRVRFCTLCLLCTTVGPWFLRPWYPTDAYNIPSWFGHILLVNTGEVCAQKFNSVVAWCTYNCQGFQRGFIKK